MNHLPLAPSDSAARQSRDLIRWRRFQRYSFPVLTVGLAVGAGLLLDHFGFRDATVELYLKAGRTPFDVNSVYLKTGKPFRAALKYRTDLYLITGQVCT
jgi:hypothetical protein